MESGNLDSTGSDYPVLILAINNPEFGNEKEQEKTISDEESVSVPDKPSQDDTESISSEPAYLAGNESPNRESAISNTPKIRSKKILFLAAMLFVFILGFSGYHYLKNNGTSVNTLNSDSKKPKNDKEISRIEDYLSKSLLALQNGKIDSAEALLSTAERYYSDTLKSRLTNDPKIQEIDQELRNRRGRLENFKKTDF
ncbi:hypothetical protein [Persicitalea jodogahamensis]|uniref:hypothetical protein n=1 Tax=Persicitalea jodogahamensis TaxID=402147 RepID=UPI0016764103|nr:hypothetical protein [Persicitalea jodogahamensis]